MGGSSSAETEAASRAGTTPFQNYSPDLLSRSNNQSQDLRLSLQSFQIPSMLLHQQQNDLFSGTANNPLGGLDGWPDHHHQNHQPSLSAATGEESSKFRRMIPWNNGAETGSSGSGPGSGGGLFVFNTPPLQPNQTAASQSALPLLLQPLFGENQNQFFSQRGPLQSSNTPSIRAWIDPISIPSTTTVNRSHNHQSYQIPSGTIDQSSPFPGYGFASGEFCGFRIPARIHGEEEHDGISDKLSSASSDSRH